LFIFFLNFFFYFKEWFYLNENAFENQSLAILNKDEHLFQIIKGHAPEPKYLPIIAYFYKQSNNLRGCKRFHQLFRLQTTTKKIG
jgi:hypothetical protein